MAKPLRYVDASRFLGAKEHKLVAALDKMLGGALLAGTLGFSELLNLFDAKAELVRQSHEALRKLSERRTGLSRFSRTQRLLLAHDVIVWVALYEAVEELRLPLPTGGTDPAVAFGVPILKPGLSYEANLDQVRSAYVAIGRELEPSNEGARVAGVAVARYEELFRQLAAEHPEVAFWASVRDGQATRSALRAVEERLERFASGQAPDQRRADLAKRNRAALARPVIAPDDVPDGLTILSLADAYLDPLFRVSPAGPSDVLSAESWWENKAVRDDLSDFLTGHLTSVGATEAPLLVLGQPGSGKSVLTKVLAARLPANDFLCVRVELRNTPADADLLGQIEYALRAALQEEISWAALARSAGDALPVILLDGFDELLQATGVSQNHYLTKIADFQRDRAELGQPVVVVVTSRTSVADRALIPWNTVALQLEPFNDQQIRDWLSEWNAANDAYFERRGLRALDSRSVLAYPELARQPLLLLMLALYDVDGNALQQSHETISTVDLYERLLSRFARREVEKHGRDKSERQVQADVERELLRLSVVAFAMFNRGAQWVTEADLDADLTALLGAPSAASISLRAPLSPGEEVLGRFFFIHRPQAVRNDKTLRTYEFLHSTFGEFLVARLTWQLLQAMEKSRTDVLSPDLIDDARFYSFLSFAPIVGRLPVVDFLREMASGYDRIARQELTAMLVTLFHSERERVRSEYQPRRLSLTARYAVYTSNLVTLAAVIRGGVAMSELFPSSSRASADWNRLVLLWKSQMSSEEWDGLLQVLTIDRSDDDIVVMLEDKPSVGSLELLGPGPLAEFERDARFLANHTTDIVLTVVELAAGYTVTRRHRVVPYQLALTSGLDDVAIRALVGDPHVDLTTLIESPAFRRPDHRQLLTFWLNSLVCREVALDAVFQWVREVTPQRLITEVADAFLDAWLRLHEAGHEVPEDLPSLPTLVQRLARYDLRPDLVTRAKRVMRELGLFDEVEWS